MQPALNDGDVYVNAGDSYLGGDYYPQEAKTEREIVEQEKNAPAVASYPVMEDVAEWFKKQIAECGDIHNIQTAKLTVGGTTYERTLSVEAQVLAYQLLKERLQDKFNEFKSFAKDQDA